MKSSQKGFTLFEVLLLVLVLGVLGGAGYYVYHSRQAVNHPAQVSSNLPQGWSLYASPTKTFTLLYPSSWNHYVPKLFTPDSTNLDNVSFGPSFDNVLVEANAVKSPLAPRQFESKAEDENTKITDTKINGYDAVYVTFISPNITQYGYSLGHKGLIVEVAMLVSSSAQAGSTDHTQYLGQFDQMAKSIKFTN